MIRCQKLLWQDLIPLHDKNFKDTWIPKHIKGDSQQTNIKVNGENNQRNYTKHQEQDKAVHILHMHSI